ncbi:Signal transduction histidine kinase [Pelagirhabdus alkalitolerans]|uniref:Circadian input-output histidine kinase CikA n=1 Tax=Pelagirhabdus alkalitolerans TaxID=1612202 RepID=A0A1G6GGF9_9BACI|nr:Signal transduction histidine kinase [Pelagirhabdus alkalitolerans]
MVIKQIYRITILFGMITFITLITAPNIHSQRNEPIILDDETSMIDLYTGSDLLKDRDGAFSIDDVTTGNLSEAFMPADDIEQQTGFFDTSTWVRFEVDNQSSQQEWILEFAFPLIYDLQLFVEENDEMVLLHHTGSDFPHHQREIDHRHFIFELSIQPGESKTYYAVAAGGGDLHPPINIWDHDAFVEKSQNEFTLLGIFYGAIFVMILYNLFVFFSLRMKSYLYYVLVITCTLFAKMSINGIAFQYIWPNAPAWNRTATPFWVGLACIFILIFTNVFLDAENYLPTFKKVYAPLIVLNSLIIISIPFSQYLSLYFMVIGSFFTFITVLSTSLLCLKRGARQARFYVVGWFIFLTGVFITILERLVVLPYSIFTEYAGQIAITMEVVLLSFALADNINIMREEKAIAEKKAQESQQLALDNLKKTDKLKDEFLAITSHELRTPLYGIIGIAESLDEGISGELSPDMKKQLSLIISSGHRLMDLVNEILDFSELKYNALKLQLKPVSINGVVDIVIALSRPLLKEKPIHINNDIHEQLPAVRADEYRLQQIFYNLVNNAIKYTDEGTITLSATVDKHDLTVFISDTGQGISDDELETIFHPFKQGDASTTRKMGGLGIGLNITKDLVTLHDGHLDVQSDRGEGTTISISLPLFKQATEPIEETNTFKEHHVMEEPELIDIEHGSSEKKARILIVDDEVVNLQVLTNQLTLNGYDVLSAYKGEDALRMINEQNIDLVILDIMMPDMSGFEVSQTIRESYSLMDLPILMLTAKNQLDDKFLSFEAGANDYLAKPCNKQELLSRVKTLIQTKKLNQDLIMLNQELEERVKARTKELQFVNDDLKITNEKLIKMADSRRQLLANIAHELGSPTTIIHNYVQSIQKGLVTIDDQRYQTLVFDKLNVLNRLINDLFDLSKLEAGKSDLTIQDIRLDEWIKQLYNESQMTVELENRVYQKANIPLSFKNYYIQIDIERMDQLFSNLISNAIKSTNEGSGRIGLKAKLLSDQQVTINVCDDGEGISEDILPNIFDRFYEGSTRESSRRQNGTGLGLAIVKQIVKSHYGEISVESEKHVGTCFSITLPITKKSVK